MAHAVLPPRSPPPHPTDFQERLEAALRDVQDLSMRAARAEAKLEMTEAMLAKMDLAKK